MMKIRTDGRWSGIAIMLVGLVGVGFYATALQGSEDKLIVDSITVQNLTTGNDSDPVEATKTQVRITATASGRSSRKIRISVGEDDPEVGPIESESSVDFGTSSSHSFDYTYQSSGSKKILVQAFHGPNNDPEKISSPVKSVTIEVIDPIEPSGKLTVTGEGSAPATITLTGSDLTAPPGETISQVTFNFGDGSANVTGDLNNPTVSKTITAAAIAALGTNSLVATMLITTNASNTKSIPAAYAVGDGLTNDGDGFLSKANIKTGDGTNDVAQFAGTVNPAGVDDFSGATVTVSLNGTEIGSASANASSRGSARAKGFSFIPLFKSNGAFALKFSGANLKNALGIRKTAGTRSGATKLTIDIAGTSLATPRINAVIEPEFTESDGNKAKVAFNFISLGTKTGSFKSLKTSARAGSAGGYAITATGPILGEFSAPVVPSSGTSITVTIGAASGSGGDQLVIPDSALVIKGDGAQSVLTYSSNLGAVTGLAKFQISNAKRKFVLVTDELANTGLPAVGADGTTADIPITIDVTTDSGVLQLTSTPEVKRSSASSGSWTR